MSTINPINYQIFQGQTIPSNRIPIVLTPADDMAYGRITVTLPLSTIDMTMAQKVYQLYPPTTGDSRWIRTGSDLYDGTCLDSSGYFNSSSQFVIDWRFDPECLVDATHGNYYSLEWYLDSTATAAVAQSAPKVIIKIKDELQ